MSIIRSAAGLRRREVTETSGASQNTLQVKVADLTILGVNASANSISLIVKTSSVSPTGVLSSLQVIGNVNVPDISILGVRTGQPPDLIALTSNISLSGVKTSASLKLVAKVASLDLTGVLNSGIYQSSTTAQAPSIGLLGGHVVSVDAVQSIGDLAFIYSGGATNENQLSSLGGMISLANNSRVISQNFTQTVNITGATIIEAYGNILGTGTLRVYAGNPPEYTWQPFGGTESSRIGASIAGNYTIGNYTEGQLYLYHDGIDPSVDLSDQIEASSIKNSTYDNISFLDIEERRVDYRCFYIKNTRSNVLYSVSISIMDQPVNDSIELGLDLAGTGDGISTGIAASIITEDIAPAGVIFSTGAITVGDLLGRETRAFWVKRNITGGLTAIRADVSKLAVQAFI